MDEFYGVYKIMRKIPYKHEGLDYVSDKEYDRRLSICEKCENYQERGIPLDTPGYIGDDMCKLCFCHMITKSAYSEAECPIHKW